MTDDPAVREERARKRRLTATSERSRHGTERWSEGLINVESRETAGSYPTLLVQLVPTRPDEWTSCPRHLVHSSYARDEGRGTTSSATDRDQLAGQRTKLHPPPEPDDELSEVDLDYSAG